MIVFQPKKPLYYDKVICVKKQNTPNDLKDELNQ